MPAGISYHPRYALKVYKLAQSGLARSRIAEAIGTDKRTFKKWLVRHPECLEALNDGYGRDGTEAFNHGKQSFKEYCLTAIPPDLHQLWRQINDLDDTAGGEKRFDLLVAGRGKRIKQQIFLHSLISTNFNKFAAMRRASVSAYDLDRWKRTDPEFLDLVNHVFEMKKDFVEGALMGLIGNGDSSATVFAAKTLLKDRGYGANLTVEHKGETTQKQIVLGQIIHQLDPRSKRKLLDKVRQQKVKALAPRVVKTEEVE